MKIQITKETIKPIELNKNNRYWWNGTTHNSSGKANVPALTAYTLLTQHGLPHKDNFDPKNLIGSYEVSNPENKFSIKIKKIA